MTRPLTVGLDGSPESLAAAGWAAREALLRDRPLRLVHASVLRTPTLASGTGPEAPMPPDGVRREYARALLDRTRARLAGRHPSLRIDTGELPGQPVTALVEAGEEAELLVLGSRGLGRLAGFLLGSVSLAVLARSELPVVLVRSGDAEEKQPPANPATEGSPATGGSLAAGRRDVVLGLDLSKPGDALIAFAFEAASRRAAVLRVVHGWTLPRSDRGDILPEPRDGTAARVPRALSEVLGPWQEKFP
ncbi:universal stress protein, partial [Streptomyces sp. UH6]|uniref:universal stress protein n=1 Tax=Streptomyces sp. UH6 TaxID=2748379 RepID=UPI0015D495B9